MVVTREGLRALALAGEVDIAAARKEIEKRALGCPWPPFQPTRHNMYIHDELRQYLNCPRPVLPYLALYLSTKAEARGDLNLAAAWREVERIARQFPDEPSAVIVGAVAAAAIAPMLSCYREEA